MTSDLKAILSDADHAAAMSEVARLWGSKRDSVEGERLDALATLIDAYEAQYHGMIDQ